MKKRVICLIISCLLVLSSVAFIYADDTLPISIYGDAAIVADLTTGEILYGLNISERRYPASLTKMLTCIIALENLDLGTTVTVDSEASGIGGNTLNLKTGEKLNAKDLLYGTMVISANDGAVAIAKAVSGTLEDFTTAMNRKAEEIGCIDTHFVNPNGLHDDNHYTTVYDLYLIAMYCMKNETFRDIVSTVDYVVPQTNMTAERTVTNTNWLLNDTIDSHKLYVGQQKRYPKYDGCIGIKTGTTNKAGTCIAAAAEKDGTQILAISLHSANTYERFSDAIALLDLGFENYKTAKPLSAGMNIGTINVKRGSVKTVDVELSQDVFATLKIEEDSSIIESKADLIEEITAPVSKGAIVGTVSIYKEGALIAEVDAVASNDVPEGGILSVFGIDDATAAKIGKVLITILIILVLLVLVFIIWVIYEKRRVRRIKARKAARLRAKQARENSNRSNKIE